MKTKCQSLFHDLLLSGRSVSLHLWRRKYKIGILWTSWDWPFVSSFPLIDFQRAGRRFKTILFTTLQRDRSIEKGRVWLECSTNHRCRMSLIDYGGRGSILTFHQYINFILNNYLLGIFPNQNQICSVLSDRNENMVRPAILSRE